MEPGAQVEGQKGKVGASNNNGDLKRGKVGRLINFWKDLNGSSVVSDTPEYSDANQSSLAVSRFEKSTINEDISDKRSWQQCVGSCENIEITLIERSNDNSSDK